MSAKIVTYLVKWDRVSVTKIEKDKGSCSYDLEGRQISDYCPMPTTSKELLGKLYFGPDVQTLIWPLPKGYIKGIN
jgi:hypothetical protein